MKTDRELIELAARASSVPLKWPFDPATYARVDGVPPRRADTWENWNPLANDGDALRLACALKINIEHAETLRRKTHGVNCWPVGRGDCAHMENDLADYNAATRRAIVCAAAALAESAAVGAA